MKPYWRLSCPLSLAARSAKISPSVAPRAKPSKMRARFAPEVSTADWAVTAPLPRMSTGVLARRLIPGTQVAEPTAISPVWVSTIRIDQVADAVEQARPAAAAKPIRGASDRTAGRTRRRSIGRLLSFSSPGSLTPPLEAVESRLSLICSVSESISPTEQRTVSLNRFASSLNLGCVSSQNRGEPKAGSADRIGPSHAPFGPGTLSAGRSGQSGAGGVIRSPAGPCRLTGA